MEKTVLRSFTALLLCFLIALGWCVGGCSEPKDNGDDAPVIPPNFIDISGYSIVYSENADSRVVRRAEKIAEAINKKWSI